MEYRIERIDSHSGRIKIVRPKTPGAWKSHFLRIDRAPRPLPVTREPLNQPHVVPLARAGEGSSPAAQARRAIRRLRRHFEEARRAAKHQARLCRGDEYQVLRIAYAAVRCWQQDGVVEEIERELRVEAEVAISRGSNLFLVLIRSALPRLDPKRASKWGAALEFADHHGVRSKRLGAFLRLSGGIEGLARERAKQSAKLW